MGQPASRPHSNGRPRLKQIHMIYQYGARNITVRKIIKNLQTKTTLNRADIVRLIRKFYKLRVGLESDNVQLGLDRQSVRLVLDAIEYLQFQTDLTRSELADFIGRLKKLHDLLADKFQGLHKSFFQ